MLICYLVALAVGNAFTNEESDFNWEHNRIMLGDAAVNEHARRTICYTAPIEPVTNSYRTLGLADAGNEPGSMRIRVSTVYAGAVATPMVLNRRHSGCDEANLLPDLLVGAASAKVSTESRRLR